MVIAIDGPAGAGKSTTAKATALSLGFSHLDTGAMYRAVALVAADKGISFTQAAEDIVIEPGPPISVNGTQPGELLRTPSITAGASKAAADPKVREVLVALQRRILSSGDWVAEGRDICSVVAPDAQVRVWLTADETRRAERRARETGQSIEEVLNAQRARDTADEGHGRSTLNAPDGATVIDTTDLSPDEVVEQIVALAQGT